MKSNHRYISNPININVKNVGLNGILYKKKADVNTECRFYLFFYHIKTNFEINGPDKTKHSLSIHLSSRSPFIPFHHQGNRKPIPAAFRREAGYTLRRSQQITVWIQTQQRLHKYTNKPKS